MSSQKIVFVSFLVLVVSGFVPILPILVLQLNGAVLFLFGSSEAAIWIVNLVASLVGFVMFYRSKKTSYKIYAVVIVTCFLFPLIVFKTEGWSNNNSLPYFLPFVIASFLAYLPLIVLSFIKR